MIYTLEWKINLSQNLLSTNGFFAKHQALQYHFNFQTIKIIK